MLLQRIGEIFDDDFSKKLERCRVPDRGTYLDELRVVLLVESPHTDEVRPPLCCDRYPLAGEAGKFTRGILDKYLRSIGGIELPDLPIGKLVHIGCPHFIRQLGIMNVSQLPFQESAYQEVCDAGITDSENFTNYKGYMNTIKNNPFALTRTEESCKMLDNAISEDLRVRLIYLYERKPDVLLIRCGEVAQGFYMKACMMNNYFPYPARHRRWNDLDYQERVCLQNIIARIIP